MSDLEVEHSANFLQFNGMCLEYLLCYNQPLASINITITSASQSLPDDTVHEDTEMKIVSTHTPLGIVGAICPWNFPLVLATGKIAASLLMGNCVIVKPSPFTPYSVLKFAELAIGTVPAGVFQALNGNNQLGEWMTAHPQIAKISFTGSTGTGRKIMESCSKTLKRITLELGGNDATIVLPDVSVERVAPQVAAGCFFNAGQMCVATKRVYVHEGIYEEFKRSFVEEVQALWRGRHEDNSIIGPLQNSMQYSVVRNLIQDSEAKGYKVALGGSDMAPTGAGFFVAPTVLDNPPDSSSVVQEEQFGKYQISLVPFPSSSSFVRSDLYTPCAGPVIPLLSWKTVDEVVTRANDTVAGLGACVWAGDVEEAERIGRRLEAGSLWLNSYEKPLPMGYFSGHKQSGIGGEWGKQGLLAYCNTQSIHIYKSH